MREMEESKEVFVKSDGGPLLIPRRWCCSLPTGTRQSWVSEAGDAVR